MDMWEQAQEWEANWHGNCVNSYGEEEKQLLYADRMGLKRSPDASTPYRFDLGGISVLDVGGGPYSLLLKCVNFSHAKVVDPLLPYGEEWVGMRYEAAGIEWDNVPGENVKTENEYIYDEVWCYNVLQHVQDPDKVIMNMKELGHIIRIFEWLETKINVGHPHTFTKDYFDKMLNGRGKVEALNGQANCCGKCYYGIFPT